MADIDWAVGNWWLATDGWPSIQPARQIAANVLLIESLGNDLLAPLWDNSTFSND